MLSHITYHEGYVQPQTNTVGDQDSEGVAAPPLWEEPLLPLVPVKEGRIGKVAVPVLGMPPEILVALPYLAYQYEATPPTILDGPLGLDGSDPRETNNGFDQAPSKDGTALVQ